MYWRQFITGRGFDQRVYGAALGAMFVCAVIHHDFLYPVANTYYLGATALGLRFSIPRIAHNLSVHGRRLSGRSWAAGRLMRSARVRDWFLTMSLDRVLIGSLAAYMIYWSPTHRFLSAIGPLAFIAQNMLFAAVSRYSVPDALFLTKSNTENRELLAGLRFAYFPNRLVALLDGDHVGVEQRAFRLDDLRTHEAEDWKALFRNLTEIVRVVVLDGRKLSKHLKYEINYLATHTTAATVVVLSRDDGESPVMNSLAPAERADLLERCEIIPLVKLGPTLERLLPDGSA